ncbi:MAG TPA: NAD(P)-dependent oxidoreductase [Thermoplasmata archaeon]|nr:NAD(P)-dependent oxidoreductase [Thermoplasmata archaeon]
MVQVRAVLPPFLPLEEIERRVGAILPGVDITTTVDAPGHVPPDKVEVLILTTFHELPASALAKFPSLKFVQVASTGYDRVDLAACRARGIMVANIPVANSKTVAEHVVLLTLALLRDLRGLDADMRRGDWPMLTGANDLAGKVFGIVGMGRIGRELAARLVPFETSTVYTDVVPLPPEEERRLGLTRVEFPELLAQADIISLHLPLTERTRGIVGAEEFARMKDQAVFINTARAELVDPTALRRAVTEGKVRAGLDVFPTEPPDFSDPIFQANGTAFTPHIAGVTFEAQQRFLQETVKNVLRFVQGKEPLYRVDPLPRSP